MNSVMNAKLVHGKAFLSESQFWISKIHLVIKINDNLFGMEPLSLICTKDVSFFFVSSSSDKNAVLVTGHCINYTSIASSDFLDQP